MSTQDMRKLVTVIESIEVIEEKANALQSEYTKAANENENQPPKPIDDSNVHLQLFFQHLEQLLQIDLKNRTFLSNSNNKRNYWNFFSLALKGSKGLYDAVTYVAGNQEVKTSTGFGRLFIRYCLQTHCLGDVIQHSFMMNKIVHQFYVNDCFWTTPTYMNRVIQALYQLSDIQFNLLETGKFQLDVSWPTVEINESHPRSLSNDPARMRNESSSSILSMNSVDTEAIVSFATDSYNSMHITPTISNNHESSTNDGSSAYSLSLVDDDPENTVGFWKEKYAQLELQLQEIQTTKISNDAEIQCTLEEEEKNENESKERELMVNENEQLKTFFNLSNEKIEQLQSEIEVLKQENEQLNNQTSTLNETNERLKGETNVLREEMTNLNFQLSSVSMQRSTVSDKMRDYERDVTQYQKLIESKDTLLNELQTKYSELLTQSKATDEKLSTLVNKQEKQLEYLEVELDKATRSLDSERKLIETERTELTKARDDLEVALREKTLDFEEMKRRLVKAVHEKAELFSSIHTYELKLEQQQAKRWVADEDADNCIKCNVAFGWTVRRHHCRQCQKIFCNQCSNNWIQNPKSNAQQYRVCDACHDELMRGPSKKKEKLRDAAWANNGTGEDLDLRFEVRPERLQTTPTTEDDTDVIS